MRRALLILVLSGCGYPTYYPQLEQAGAVSAGTDTGFSEPEIFCSRADEGTTAQLTLINDVDREFRLATVDVLTCEEVFYRTLAPLEVLEVSVGNHLTFTARRADDDRLVKVFGIPSGTQVSWTEHIP